MYQPVRVIERYLKKYIRGTALDAGCGVGRNLSFFPQDGIGLDNDLGALQEARKINSNVILADLNYKLPFIDEAFDFILCSGVLEHLEAPYKTMKEFHRILVREGILIIGIPNPYCIYNNYYDLTLWRLHNYSWTYGEAKRFILNLNFSVKKACVHPPLFNNPVWGWLWNKIFFLKYITSTWWFICEKEKVKPKQRISLRCKLYKLLRGSYY